METGTLISALALFTLSTGFVVGIWQTRAARRAKERGSTSALARRSENRSS